MKVKEKINSYFQKKTRLGLASDFLFVLIVVAMVFPQSRMWLIANINKVKIIFMQPTVIEEDKATTLALADYQFTITGINGNNLDFSSLKGKVIFVNFWATWCPPCVAEMPSIQKLYNDFKGNSQVAFVLLTNDDKSKVSAFLSKKGFDMPVYFVYSGIPEILSTRSIPATFLISKQGKIVIKEIGAVDWNGNRVKTEINKLISE